MSFDHSFTLFLNQLAFKHVALDWIIIFFSKWAILIFFVAFLGILFFTNDKRREVVYQFLFFNTFAIGIALVVFNQIMGMIEFRARPFISINTLALIQASPFDNAFPSVHTMIAFLVAVVWIFIHKRIGVLLFGLAFLIGLSRVVAGVHFFSDVVVGMLLGMLGAWCMQHFFLEAFEPQSKN